MYYAHSYRRAPKKRLQATVFTADGESYEGCLFLSGDLRISDLLNGENQFIPFEEADGNIQILNRSMISRVIPRENQPEELEEPVTPKADNEVETQVA